MTEISSDIYPQRGAAGSVATTSQSVRGPNFFKWGENISFERLWSVESVVVDGPRLRISCQTRTYINARTWTHETTMHQMHPADVPPGSVEIEITFWSDGIFRVRFGKYDVQSVGREHHASRRLYGHLRVESA